jgi:hypothetical protein
MLYPLPSLGQFKKLRPSLGIAGWEKFVKGYVVSLDFGPPIDFSDPAAVASTNDYQKPLTNTLQTTVQPQEKDKLLGGNVSISIGSSWSF